MENKHLGSGCAFHPWAADCSISHVCSSAALMVSSPAFLRITSVQLENSTWSPWGLLACCNPSFPLCCVWHWSESWSFSAEERHPHHGLSRALLVVMVLNATRPKATRHSPCSLFLCWAEGRSAQSSLINAQQEQPVVKGHELDRKPSPYSSASQK